MNPADVAVIAVTITSLANTAAILAGVRMLAKQLRIAAPPKEPLPDSGQAAGGAQ